ncbi:hypothetical protein [Deinococcus multiflagellatus]|uniref:Uncharacterized protein n=1 Tax=Deinococcus multiflagellatus TaxID=1656887 RepID=A0ABW1ZMN9_9DEIO|nr:hypothetical protein [Deinococcus multiflagellatus]MBZ9715960.1 hypothetical protein [Deinococcus multiflagellatus]
MTPEPRQCRLLYTLDDDLTEVMDLVYEHPEQHFTFILMSWLAATLNQRYAPEHPDLEFKVIWAADWPYAPLGIGVLSNEFEERWVAVPSQDEPGEMTVDRIGNDYTEFEREACAFIDLKMRSASVFELARYAAEHSRPQGWGPALAELLKNYGKESGQA